MKRIGQYAISLAMAVLLPIGAMAAVDTAGTAGAPQLDAQSQVIRGTFTQRKYLAELQQPLVSSGHYVVAAGHGLIWQVDQPIQAELVISRNYLTRRSNGHEVTRITAAEQPALHIVAAVMLAVFQADTTRLKQYFTVQKQPDADHGWAMTLQPKSATVARFIDHVRVHGTDAGRVDHIELYQPSGDHTVIDLHVSAAGPDRLSAAEQARFAQ